MSHSKNKFDLTHLIQKGLLTDGQTIFFVSDSSKSGVIKRQPSHDYKVDENGTLTTVHAFVQRHLGQEPPDHASKWVRTSSNKTLYDLWQESITTSDE